MVSIFKRRDFYAICGFFAISPFLTWLNKYILNNGSDIFQLVFFQQFMSFLIYSLNISQKWKFHHLKICALPAVFLTLQLVLSNVCLKGTSLPLYQVTRATSLFFSITTVERCRASQIAGATGVGLGFIIAALDKAQYISDLKRTWTAILAGIGASAAGVAFMSYSRRTSIELGSSTLFVRLLTLNTAMFLVPVMAFTSQKANFFTFNLYTEIALLITALIAPTLPLCSAVALQSMSPLSCTVLGLAKSTVQTAIGAILFGPPLSFQASFGALLCILGSAVYYTF